MTDPERIVIVNDTVSTMGGAAKLAVLLAEKLAARGNAVTFFSGDDGAGETLTDHGVDLVTLGGKTLLDSPRGFIDGLYNREAASRLGDWIAANDDAGVVYHVHAWSQILSPSIFDALRPVAERTVITAHDFFLVCPNGTYSIYRRSRQCSMKPMSAPCVFTDCDKRNYAHKAWRILRQGVVNAKTRKRDAPFSVLSIQSGMVPFLVRGGLREAQIRTIANPAPKFVEARVAAENNREILYVGRIEPEKGVVALAAAARAIGAPLRIVGAGVEEAAVRAANPDAIFQGWSSPTEIAEALTRARFFVMPSLCTEPFGLAAAEALRAGVPVLTSTSCLIGEDVARLGMGEIVDVADNVAFERVLTSWMNDDDAIVRMSNSAFENAGAIAQSEDDWVGAHLEHYQEMLGAG